MASYPTMRPGMESGDHQIKLPEGNFGVPDMMMHGFQHAQSGNSAVHPLEFSEKNWHGNKLKMDMSMLRNMQGLHAPLKIQMEHRIARQMRRLPGLASSNIMEDSLSGRDELIDFGDFLNVADERETMMQPHIQVEKQHHLL